jgi:hypothetical protein
MPGLWQGYDFPTVRIGVSAALIAALSLAFDGRPTSFSANVQHKLTGRVSFF